MSKHHRKLVGWGGLRLTILRRDPMCMICMQRGKVTASEEVDHIVPLHKGGTNDPENLQGVCSDCHKVKTARDLGQHVRPTFNSDGWPADPSHPWNRGR